MASNGSRGRGLTKRCVLIVEPERDMRETLGDILIAWGYLPQLAATGREALGLARARLPWAVVSELHLQDLESEDLLGELRRFGEVERPVFIALTSWCRVEDRLHAERAGFDRFLSKPADLERLRRLLAVTPLELPRRGEPKMVAPGGRTSNQPLVWSRRVEQLKRRLAL